LLDLRCCTAESPANPPPTTATSANCAPDNDGDVAICESNQYEVVNGKSFIIFPSCSGNLTPKTRPPVGLQPDRDSRCSIVKPADPKADADRQQDPRSDARHPPGSALLIGDPRPHLQSVEGVREAHPENAAVDDHVAQAVIIPVAEAVLHDLVPLDAVG